MSSAKPSPNPHFQNPLRRDSRDPSHLLLPTETTKKTSVHFPIAFHKSKLNCPFVLMFGIGKNGGKRYFLTTMYYCIKMELFCSTTKNEANLMPEFLVNSLGFSTEKAISASTKLTFLKPENNKPEIIVNYFKQIGLNNTQIKTLVSSSPGVLFADVSRTLEPKIKVLQDYGLSGLDLANVVSRSGCFIRTGLDTRIRPSLNYLRELLGSDDAVAIALKRCPTLLRYRLDKTMSSNVLFLQNLGFLNSDIVKLVVRNPRIFLQDPKWLEDKVQRVEKEFSIRKDSRMFLYGVQMISSLSKPSLEMKIAIFKSFGWSDSDIITMVQRLPFCLTISEAKIRKVLKFFMGELGYESCYLASHPTLLMFSLEKRVLPRKKILELLKEKQLINPVPCFYTVMKCSDSEFLENYALRLRDEMPEVYDFYIKSGN